MLDASTMHDVEVKLKESRMPPCNLIGGVITVEYAIKSVMIGVDCRTILFKARAQMSYGPYNW